MTSPSKPLIEVPTEDGWTLHLEAHLPPAEPRGAMLLGPGMMLDRRAMDRPTGQGLATFFRDRDFAAYTLDLRGKGAGGPKAGSGGRWTYDDLVLHDLPTALTALADLHPHLPRVLLGHSLSAHVGAATVGIHPELPVDALVLLAPVVWIRRHEPSRVQWILKRAILSLWHGVTRTVGHFPARRLGIGTEDEPPGYVSQFPAWARQNRWAHRSGEPDYLEALARVRQPTLVVAGGADRIARPAAVERFARALGGDTVAFRTAPGAGHMDLIDGRASRDLWRELADWIDRLQLRGGGSSGSVRTR